MLRHKKKVDLLHLSASIPAGATLLESHQSVEPNLQVLQPLSSHCSVPPSQVAPVMFARK